MTNVFIIHGVSGYPEENWFPWLKKELEARGHNVIVPQFPTPENQTLKSWFKTLEEYKEFITPSTLFVGHSLGVPFVLNIIEKQPIKAAFLVSGFVGKAGNDFDDSMKTFAQKTFDWEQIKKNCKNLVVFHSDNDPYIKLKKAQELAEHLGVKVNLVKGAGHFNAAAGYDTFDLLLKKIKSIL
ncbi:alpha/beta hydrolase [Patescibacteria group bacterium]|nr:alpha/beta hydrolase [Patescibacteria group bacterium]MBU1015975.1 alpha/beta hydrolase [Patescibacteria group bacterium]MBU1684816.1 alpha/beta hydrolase [Patescibacteria group bacterium]MBU1938786.1 alpha/beta hydrolase [Patescibacteria group bacterium]